jgi:hypothetical protein
MQKLAIFVILAVSLLVGIDAGAQGIPAAEKAKIVANAKRAFDALANKGGIKSLAAGDITYQKYLNRSKPLLKKLQNPKISDKALLAASKKLYDTRPKNKGAKSLTASTTSSVGGCVDSLTSCVSGCGGLSWTWCNAGCVLSFAVCIAELIGGK